MKNSIYFFIGVVCYISLMLVSVWVTGLSFGVDVKVSDKIYPVKYKLGAIKVYSDAERDAMIAASVDTGTGSLKESDFIAQVITADEQAVIDELNSEGVSGGRSSILDEIKNRTSKSFNLDRLIEIQKEQDALNKIKTNNPAFDVSEKEAELLNEYNLYKARYSNGQ